MQTSYVPLVEYNLRFLIIYYTQLINILLVWVHSPRGGPVRVANFSPFNDPQTILGWMYAFVSIISPTADTCFFLPQPWYHPWYATTLTCVRSVNTHVAVIKFQRCILSSNIEAGQIPHRFHLISRYLLLALIVASCSRMFCIFSIRSTGQYRNILCGSNLYATLDHRTPPKRTLFSLRCFLRFLTNVHLRFPHPRYPVH